MITRTLALLLLVAIVLPASVLVQFDPPGANLAGAPGQTVSWNFKITNTVDYLLISQVDDPTLTPAGIFQDTFSAIRPGHRTGRRGSRYQPVHDRSACASRIPVYRPVGSYL